MLKTNNLLTNLFLILALVFAFNAYADTQQPSHNDTLQLLNKSSGLNIRYELKDGTKELKFGDYNNGNYEEDYGEALIKGVFGDFKNVSDDQGETRNSHWIDQYVNVDDYKPIAGIFQGQNFIIKMLQVGMLKLSSIIVIIAIVSAFLMVTLSLALSNSKENDKDFWGHFFSHKRAWRVLFGLLLTMVTTNGYTLGQLLYTQTNLFSNYLGRVVASSAIGVISPDYIKNALVASVAEELRKASNPTPIMKDIILAEYCVAEMNEKNKENTIDGNKPDYLYGNYPMIENNTVVINYGPITEAMKVKSEKGDVIFTNNRNLTNNNTYLHDLREKTKLKPLNYCGAVFVPGPITYSVHNPYSKMSAELVGASAYAVMQTSKVAEKFIEEESKSENGGFSSFLANINTNKVNDVVKEMNKVYFENYLNRMKLIFGNTTTLSKQITPGAMGLFSALQFHNNFDYTVEQEFFEALITLNKMIMDGDIDNYEKLVNEYARKIAKDIYERSVEKNKQGENGFITRDKMYYGIYKHGWIDLGSYYTALSRFSQSFNLIHLPILKSIGANLQHDKTSSNLGENQGNSANNANSLDIAKYNKLSNIFDPAVSDAGNDVFTQSMEKIRDIRINESNNKGIGASKYLNPVFYAFSIGYNVHDIKTPPLVQLKNTGESMLTAVDTLLATKVLSSFMGREQQEGKNTLDNANTESNNLTYQMNSILKTFGHIGVGLYLLALVLAVCGFLLAIYLPLLPTIYWSIGVATWIFGMIVNFVSIPVIGLVMMFSNGDEFLGRAMNAFMAILDTFLRPMLMVMSLLLVIITQALLVPLVSILITNAYLYGNISGGFVGIIFFVILYVYINYLILSQSASLIKILPEEIMKRINGIVAVNDETDQSLQKIAGALQQGKGEGSSLLHMMGRSTMKM